MTVIIYNFNKICSFHASRCCRPYFCYAPFLKFMKICLLVFSGGKVTRRAAPKVCLDQQQKICSFLSLQSEICYFFSSLGSISHVFRCFMWFNFLLYFLVNVEAWSARRSQAVWISVDMLPARVHCFQFVNSVVPHCPHAPNVYTTSVLYCSRVCLAVVFLLGWFWVLSIQKQ